MSLYDGLGIDNNKGGKDSKPDVSGWSSSFKLLQTQLQAKKASLLQTKRKSGGTTLAPVVDLKRSRDEECPLHFNLQTGRIERLMPGTQGGSVPTGPSPFIGSEAPISSPSASLLGVSDEYNPRFPNEYEDFVKKRREQKQREREDERKKELEEREKRRKERHRAKGDIEEDDESEFDKRKRMRDEDEEEEFTPVKRAGSSTGAAIAPPPSLMEEDSLPEEDSNPFGNFKPPDEKLTAGASFGLAGSVASKIMAKYGYKEGQGLGKKEQGMSMALQVEKTSKRGGKIIHERDIPKEPFVVPEPPKPEPTTTNILKNPSKVIILRNMVGPGEVDEDLEPETAEECGKYGKVVKCVIFEIPGGEDEEAVRIFVEFERIESAIKAIVDLNGRYFGGRVVKAGFYNLDKFRRLDLLDPM